MVRNLVAYNVKEDTSEERIRAFADAAYRLIGALPFVRRVCVGEAFSRERTILPTYGMAPPPDDGPAYRYYLDVEFDDRDAQLRYLMSDAHTEYVREHFAPLVANYRTFTYDAPERA